MKAKHLLSTAVACGMLIIQPVSATQFSPGQEAQGAGGGGATMLDIKQAGPGKAVFSLRHLNAVFLDKAPAKIKASFSKADESGKGTAIVADVASNPSLAGAQLCWRGVGSDWGNMACGPIKAGGSDVTIDVGSARGTAFALVPVIMEGKKQVTWAAHPENTQVMLDCPGMQKDDMASVFSVRQDGTIHIASSQETAQYQKHYAKFCQRKG